MRKIAMPSDFEVSSPMPASPATVFSTWMSSEGHSAMTGGDASVDARVGGAYTAWNGYIQGRTIELEAPTRIVQSWRTTDFTADDEDSRIDVRLADHDGGTLVTIRHSNVPDGHDGYENGGWEQSYFGPMRAYFDAP